MSANPNTDTRTRLLDAAATLVAANPGGDFSLRAVCDAAGVKLPTMYHFFGSKSGLVDAVIERGFDMYLTVKSANESSGDPIGDIRAGWDAHVEFGIENPGFYTLMYGQVRPGEIPAAQSRPTGILLSLTDKAEAEDRLVVPSAHAAEHILSANIGLTLRLIARGTGDKALSDAMRDAVVAAITGTSASAASSERPGGELIETAAARPEILGDSETTLFVEWARRIRNATGSFE
ncbi:TetR/AcrR family transcriptional regulator [Dietzia sp.]|uniref:TetR/AcrR family transcriptional regulator n=1 Tax=Dietzia sp. TaxID=1871616 RepID=UPI002FDA5F33